MKISQLLDIQLDEARPRTASQQAGRNLGRQIAAGQPQADTAAQIAQARAAKQAAQQTASGAPAGQQNLAQRLADYKAIKQRVNQRVADYKASQAGAGAFDNMVNTVTGGPSNVPNNASPSTTPSASGGTITQTNTGLRHTAAPNAGNPAQGGPAPAQGGPTPPQGGPTPPQGGPAPAQGGPTGDPTLDQPLPGSQQPKKTLAQRIGSISKGIGAIASVPQGVGRAMKKGYQAGVQSIGGPGVGDAVRGAVGLPPSASTTSRPTTGVDPVQDIVNRLNAMDQRLRMGGLEERRKN